MKFSPNDKCGQSSDLLDFRFFHETRSEIPILIVVSFLAHQRMRDNYPRNLDKTRGNCPAGLVWQPLNYGGSDLSTPKSDTYNLHSAATALLDRQELNRPVLTGSVASHHCGKVLVRDNFATLLSARRLNDGKFYSPTSTELTAGIAHEFRLCLLLQRLDFH